MEHLIDWAAPPLAAAFVWWLGTVAVMWLGTLPRTGLRLALALLAGLALAAALCIGHAVADARPAGAYAAFCSAVLLWGALELGFLGGWLAGPRRQPATARHGTAAHWWQGTQAVLWHQLAIAAVAAALASQCWGQPNALALHTFLLLWVMRLSAQLNLVLGVAFDGAEFLPARLAYLASYFGRPQSRNWLLPLSMLAGTAALVAWVMLAVQAVAGSGERTGWLLLAALMLLALAEHAFMRWPIPHGVLWQAARPPLAAAEGNPR